MAYSKWRTAIASMLVMVLALKLDLFETVSASHAASPLAQLRVDIEAQSTRKGLFDQWRYTKNALVLAGKLSMRDRVNEIMQLDPDIPDYEIFASTEIETLKSMMLDAVDINQELFYDDETGRESAPSTRAWGGWYESDSSSRRLTQVELRRMACQSVDKLTNGESLLRAAEFILFNPNFDCQPLKGANPRDLLGRAIAFGVGDASIKAQILQSALTLGDDLLHAEDDFFDKLESTSSSEEEPSRVTETLAGLQELAHDTNHPMAHLILARHFGTRPLGLSGSTSMRDCDRATTHLLQALWSVESLVGDLSGGARNRPDDRASQLHAAGDLDDPSVFATGFESEEAFIEHELHLQELSRSVEADADALNDGHLDLQLGDLYMHGAPEVGVPAQPNMAERMYRRAMRFGNGMAATQLASMTLSNQASIRPPTSATSTTSDDYDDGLYSEDSYSEPSKKAAESKGATESDADYEKRRNETAFALYQKAAEWGDPIGYVGLGLFYENADAPQVPIRDAQRALKYYDLAASRGAAEGDYRAGRLLLSDALLLNTTLGLERLRKAAEKGHVAASYELGYATFFLDWTQGGCERSITWLIRAVRSDWTTELPFDIRNGLKSLATGPSADDFALRVFLTSHVVLWQKYALVNAAFSLERGHFRLIQSDSLASNLDGSRLIAPYNEDPSKIPSNVMSILRMLDEQFSWPVHWRRDETSRLQTKLAFNLHARVAGETGDGEARRKIAECLEQGWPGACDKNLDAGRALWHLRQAEQADDAESVYRMSILRFDGSSNGVAKNVTAAFDGLARVYALDGNAWFLVEATRLIWTIKSWLGRN